MVLLDGAPPFRGGFWVLEESFNRRWRMPYGVAHKVPGVWVIYLSGYLVLDLHFGRTKITGSLLGTIPIFMSRKGNSLDL